MSLSRATSLSVPEQDGSGVWWPRADKRSIPNCLGKHIKEVIIVIHSLLQHKDTSAVLETKVQ